MFSQDAAKKEKTCGTANVPQEWHPLGAMVAGGDRPSPTEPAGETSNL